MKTHQILIAFLLLATSIANLGFANERSANVACPFCSAVQQTITEQMADSDVVVIARLIETIELPADSEELPKAVFEVTNVIKGLPEIIGVGEQFRAITIGDYQVGQKVVVMGVQPPKLSWTTPMKVSEHAEEYLNALSTLPVSGAERLRFFQQYLEDKEPLLSFDAYEEFARASYADVIALKPWMNHDQLISWLKDPEVSTNRKRLYYTLLGVCGSADDLDFLESLIQSEIKEDRRGLDSLVACYLGIKGESGMDLIDRQFFENPKCDYVDAFAAISAIRFHATERDVISRERILASFHKILKTPERADLVIPDLARWQDWSVIDEMVLLFKNADEKSKWVRVPVVSYLQVCPRPEAKKAVEELTKLDPESVRRAQALMSWENGGEDDWDDDSEEKTTDKKSEDAKDTTPSKTPSPNGGTGNEPATGSGGVDTVENNLDESFNSFESELSNFRFVSQLSGNNEVPIYNVERLNLGDNHDDSETPLENSIPNGRSEYTSTTAGGIPLPANSLNGSATTTPEVVAQVSSLRLTLALILLPVVLGGLIFLLSWSVINGWFERLIF